MNSNGKDTETTLLNNNQEIILMGSLKNLKKHIDDICTYKSDCINIFYTGTIWISQYHNYKTLSKYMIKREDGCNYQNVVINLLVADELKILTLMETMSIGLLEAVCLLYIENKEVNWQYYK